MARPKFDPKEFEVVGTYPPLKSFNMSGRPAAQPEPKFDRPISPKENFELLLSGKKPYWIPIHGFYTGDLVQFRPRMHPDNVATHLAFDYEDLIQYETNITTGLFNLPWEWVDMAGGATVHPGKPAVTDINRWEEYVPFPNLDDWDWENCIAKNKELLQTDRLVQVAMLSGLWERLISLMDVENAAIALIDDDQKEGVHRLFDRLCTFYDEYIDRLHKNFNIDAFLIHDDWGHQRAPFFSLETCREMLVPYLKRIVDSCHKRGIYFELHSCGYNERLVPAMIEAGVDLWCGQPMNDYHKLATTYKDSGIAFGVAAPPPAGTEEETRQMAREFVDKYKDLRIVLTGFMANPAVVPAIYEYSRRAYENEP